MWDILTITRRAVCVGVSLVSAAVDAPVRYTWPTDVGRSSGVIRSDSGFVGEMLSTGKSLAVRTLLANDSVTRITLAKEIAT